MVQGECVRRGRAAADAFVAAVRSKVRYNYASITSAAIAVEFPGCAYTVMAGLISSRTGAATDGRDTPGHDGRRERWRNVIGLPREATADRVQPLWRHGHGQASATCAWSTPCTYRIRPHCHQAIAPQFRQSRSGCH